MLKKIAFLCFLLIPFVAFCQPQDNSPYSRFGMGDIVDRNFMSSQFMGGLGASLSDPYQINIVNPASFGSLAATSFDIGLFAENSNLRDGISPNNPVRSPYQSLWKGNLSYLSLAIPLQNRLNDLLDRKKSTVSVATGFSLMPYSTVGYNVKLESFDDDIGLIKKRFEGSGGTYQFLWSNGIRLDKFSFGMNLGYLFGKLENKRVVEFEPTQPFFITELSETNRVNGFLWNAGVMYSLHLNKAPEVSNADFVPKRITFGLHGNSSTGFTTTTSSFQGAVLAGSEATFLVPIRDSLNSTDEDIVTSGTLPAEIGIGATYFHGEKFALGFNYSATSWSQLEASFVNNKLNNTSKLSFGGFYRPNYKSIGNYFERVYYRFGVYLNQVPNEVPLDADQIIRDFGISVGVGLPFFYQRKVSHANLGITYGWLGQGTPVEERYLRLSFSFTFNDDEWLLKRKYN